MRDFLADDQHADAARVPLRLLRLADVLRDLEEMRGELRRDVDPVVDLLARHDERVPRHERLDGEERDDAVVVPHEPSRDFTVDDAREQRRHAAASSYVAGAGPAPSTAWTR